MPDHAEPQRCRLVLALPATMTAAHGDLLAGTLAAGDVASVILPQHGLSEAAFQALAEALVPIVQQAGAAAILAGDSRIAARVHADGIHLDAKPDEIADFMERNGNRMIVGVGGATTRDGALQLGERQPDYIFFGRFGYDTKAEPHRRNLSLGRWWAEMVEIPCIVLGGNEIVSALDVAETGAEFVALSSAIFDHRDGTAAAVGAVNRLLDESAPALASGAS